VPVVRIGSGEGRVELQVVERRAGPLNGDGTRT